MQAFGHGAAGGLPARVGSTGRLAGRGSCLFPTRSQAKEACEAGKVEVNGGARQAAPPGPSGDRLTVTRGAGDRREIVVQGLAERSIPKRGHARLYEDVTPPASGGLGGAPARPAARATGGRAGRTSGTEGRGFDGRADRRRDGLRSKVEGMVDGIRNRGGLRGLLSLLRARLKVDTELKAVIDHEAPKSSPQVRLRGRGDGR